MEFTGSGGSVYKGVMRVVSLRKVTPDKEFKKGRQRVMRTTHEREHQAKETA